MNIGVLYVITCVMCFFEIALIINRTKQTKYKETIDSHFCYMLYFYAFFCCIDMLWGFFSSQTVWMSKLGFTLVSYGFHSAAAVSAYIWFGYMLYYTDTQGTDRIILNYLRHILILIQIIVLGANHFTHMAFYVDEQCNYYTGKLRNLLYLLQYFYFFILIIYSIRMIIKGKGKKFSNALLFSLVPLSFGILQYVFYDAALYSIGFMLSAFIIYSFNVTIQREQALEDRYHSLNRKQTGIIYGLAGDFAAIFYVDIESGKYETYKKDPQGRELIKENDDEVDFFENLLNKGQKNVARQDKEKFIENFSREAILTKLQKNNSYSENVRFKISGRLKYYRFSFIYSVMEEEHKKLIVGMYDVDDEVKAELKRQEQERKYSLDPLTGLLNRRVYEADIARLSMRKLDQELVYISFDVNELKIINDSLGHEAGDELINGAAQCITNSFADNGKVYRIGGDEFAAIVYANEELLATMTGKLNISMKKWTGKYFDTLSISYGVVSVREKQDASLKELAQMADKRMYINKAQYYAGKGIDRKGQKEAYDAVCSSYTKILKANLTDDSFSIIQMDLFEKKKELGYSERMSKWMKNFAECGNIHEADLEFYLSHTDIDYLRNYFHQGNSYMCLYYKRRIRDQFRLSLLEMIPAGDYSDDHQSVFMYVKNIDRMK